jgi:hypothetical protein
MSQADYEARGLHPDTAKLVHEFANALADKLHAAEIKYGYTNGWLTDDWQNQCRGQLHEHISKGDPLDVAAYCAFMWQRGWSTSGWTRTLRPPRDISHGSKAANEEA